MGFRVVRVESKTKLDLRTNYLVSRGIEEIHIYIPEISVLILESTSISMTVALISELVKNNVKIIFCDEKHNPESEVIPYYNSYHSSKMIKQQIIWNEEIKGKVWQKIVRNKIKTQQKFLSELGYITESEMLEIYLQELDFNDITNREGHSAKVYFNSIFSEKNFTTRRSDSFINSALNYGYSIILSWFNREITAHGYLTQLGIWHKNEYNQFNLACDLMEPFRVIVDRAVYNLNGIECEDYKTAILNYIWESRFVIDKKEKSFEKTIERYCQSVFSALNNNDESLVKFYEV